MSTATHSILAQVSVRLNALDGTDSVDLETTYSTLPLPASAFISSIFPQGAIIDACVNAEEKLATAIGFSANRSLRAYLASVTDSLANGASLPSLDVNGDPIVGNFGAVRDVTTARKLTRKPVATIENYLSATGIYLVPIYNYALDSGSILHTRTTVTLECCVYNAETQTAAYNNNENTVMPDSLVPAIVQGALAMLVRDDEFLQQSQAYANYFAVELAAIPPGQFEQQAI